MQAVHSSSRGMGPRMRSALAAAGLACASLSAQAALFNFSGVTDSGPLAGQAFSGSFAYAEPAAGFDGEVALQSFALDFAGQSYTLATADAGSLLDAFFVAGLFVGIDYQDIDFPDAGLRPQIQLIAGFSDVSQAVFSYVGRDAAGIDVQGFGGYTVTAATNAVAEPGSLAITLLGLGGLAATTRRRAGRSPIGSAMPRSS